MPAPGAVAVTVAVKVTDCPEALGFADGVTAADVLALPIICQMAGEETLLLKVALPAYIAVRKYEPTPRVVWIVAFPVLSRLPEPMEVVPSKNVTVPPGTVVPEAGVTVAVSVTG